MTIALSTFICLDLSDIVHALLSTLDFCSRFDLHNQNLKGFLPWLCQHTVRLVGS